MKQYIIKLSGLALILLSMTSCLKKDSLNIDPDNKTSSFLELQFIEGGSGSTINSGLNYFSGGALTYESSHTRDTANYNINLGGASPLTKDLTVTVGVDASKILDYYKNDSIKYELMPDSLYKFLSKTTTIPAGSRTANMQIEFYPSKIDPTKSYMLPVVITDPSGATVSSNYGTIYYHVIGNPIAGKYAWDYIRWNLNDPPVLGTYPSGASSGWTGDEQVFLPVNPTTVKLYTGYYYQIDYVMTFKNNNGVLSDFSVTFDQDQYNTYFVANGVTLVGKPSITVSPDYKTFEVQYIVSNGSAYRYIVDKFYK